ncbi:MAG: 50S ribosomal protein L11 methyltransferase [Vicinamibacterales bacterium]
MDASPALIVRFPAGTSAAVRDRLVALVADYELVAVQEDDLTAPQVWTAHFSTAAHRDAASAAVGEDAEFAQLELTATEVPDEDWARRTQADLPAIRIGRVTVAPPWDVPPASPVPHPASPTPHPANVTSGPHPAPRTPHPDDVLVLIEPSRGFGTGHHQSTRLCIVLLQNRNLSGLTVTDVGTGSGVLAITAAKLGAAFVSAIDTDPDAVENARENIAANGVEKVVEAHVDDLSTTTVPAADLVTANLTGTLLVHHAADLARLVRPSGSLLVSGFNVDEKARVMDALAPHFAITESAEEDDWFACLVSRLPRA